MNKFLSFFVVLFLLFSSEAQAQGMWTPGPMSMTPDIEMCGPDEPYAEIRKSGTGNGATRVVCDPEFGSSRTIYDMRPSDKYEIAHGNVVVKDVYGFVKFIGLRFTVNMAPWNTMHGSGVLMVGMSGGNTNMFYEDPDTGVQVAVRRRSPILGCLFPNFRVLAPVRRSRS